MRQLFASTIAAVGAVLAASPAVAGVQLGAPLGTAMPFGNGGLIGLVAAAVVAGAFIARRKR